MASLHHPLPSYPDTSVGESDFFRLLGGGWWGGAERQPVARQGNFYHIHDAERRAPPTAETTQLFTRRCGGFRPARGSMRSAPRAAAQWGESVGETIFYRAFAVARCRALMAVRWRALGATRREAGKLR